jgi:hypothetical protein
MKNLKTFNKQTLMIIGASIMGLTSLNSCGTFFNALAGGKRPTMLVNGPKDFVVKLNGEEQNITSESFAGGGIGNVDVTYYGAAVNLPFKKPLTVEISSMLENKTGSVNLTPKNSGAIFFLNLITFPIVGHIIDGVTKNNKVLQPKYVDVNSVLNNVPMKDWPSQGQLKRISKSKAKQNTTKTMTFN